MTIYTPSQNDKDKAKLIPEVVTDPTVDIKDSGDEESTPPRYFRVTLLRRNGRSFYIHLLFALAVLVILACGALGAVVFYKHLHKKHTYIGQCRAAYFDTSFHQDMKVPPPPPSARAEPMTGMRKKAPTKEMMNMMEEDIVVMEEEQFEELHTPAFDEVRESYVRHNFNLNFTAIVDHQYKQCFVMALNRTEIAPPRTVIDLLRYGFLALNYLRRARVIRQDYHVAYAMEDLSMLGRRIAHDCAPYPTHWLEKKVTGVYKRSVAMKEEEQEVSYAMMSNFPKQQVIYKLFIRNFSTKTSTNKLQQKETPTPVAA